MSIQIHVTPEGKVEIAATRSYRTPAEGGVDFERKFEEGEITDPGYGGYRECGSVEEALDIAGSMIANGLVNRPAAAAKSKAEFEAATAAYDDGDDD